MRSKGILASLLIFTLIFVTLFSSSISFAAKPIGTLTLVRGDIQPTSLTIVVSWEKVPAYTVEFKIDEFDIFSNTIVSTKYYNTLNLEKRTTYYDGLIHYASWNEPASFGSRLIVTVNLLDKKGNIIISKQTAADIY